MACHQFFDASLSSACDLFGPTVSALNFDGDDAIGLVSALFIHSTCGLSSSMMALITSNCG